MQKMKLVMVGNGMAGVRTLEELLKLAPDLYDITVFGAEPHANYNRITAVAGAGGRADDTGHHAERSRLVHANKHHPAPEQKDCRIDRKNRVVMRTTAPTAEYDRLLLATGSNPFILPIPGNDLPGVIGYRDIQDTNAMIAAAQAHRHAVVIGGGLLGLEAANGLKLRGMDVSPWCTS